MRLLRSIPALSLIVITMLTNKPRALSLSEVFSHSFGSTPLQQKQQHVAIVAAIILFLKSFYLRHEGRTVAYLLFQKYRCISFDNDDAGDSMYSN